MPSTTPVFLHPLILLLAGILGTWPSSQASGEDYFLTIGGGYSRSGNQASIERNVLFFQRVLQDQNLDRARHDIYFADGHDETPDVQVLDKKSVPLANRLMAEFFGSQENLGLRYRNHEIENVRDSTEPENIRNWFSEVGATMKPGDRLFLYVTSHGNRSTDKENPYNTSIALWRSNYLKVDELADLLDSLPDGVSVATVMVQCHAGGFARLIYNQADPEKGVSSQTRCGFFATFHDRAAAGCTAESREETYVEYSTYFWGALSGFDRMGNPVEMPDYDQNGSVSFAEAHAYTMLHCDTIDVPLKTSTEYLRIDSRFGDAERPDLLSRKADYSEVLELANPEQRVVIEGLSQQLSLTSEKRLDEASRLNGGSRTPRGQRDSDGRLRRRIAGDLKRRWPEIGNLMNPLTIELVTSRSDEFVDAVQTHPKYQEYCDAVDASEQGRSDSQTRAKRDRLVLTIEEIILAENLRRLGDEEKLAEYQRLLDAENGTLGETSPKVSALY